jgi:hypothetical protein
MAGAIDMLGSGFAAAAGRLPVVKQANLQANILAFL